MFRNFYRILTGSLDLKKFSLGDCIQPTQLRIIVLAFNTFPRVLDGRSRRERLADPRIADIAWNDVEVHTLKLRQDQTRLILKDARMIPSVGSSPDAVLGCLLFLPYTD